MTPETLLGELARREFDAHVEAFFDADALRMAEEAIAGARSSIDLEMFMLGGPLGERIVGLLNDKAKAGVRVRLIHTEGLSIRIAVALKRLMLLTTGRALDVSRDHVPVARRLLGRGGRRSGVEWKQFPMSAFPGSLTAPLQLAHDKILIVDERVAVTGGMNLASAVSGNHDLFVRIRGAAIAGLQLLFDYDWWLASGHRTEVPGWRPGPYRVDDAGGSPSRLRYLFTRPHGTEGLNAILDALAAARGRIWVEMFYVIEPRVNRALGDAVARGLDVRVICDPNEYSLGLPMRGAPNLPYVRELQQSGVSVRLFPPGPGAQMHQKSMIVDDDLVIAGSTNLTRQSFRVNTESAVVVRSAALVPALERRFLVDWQRSMPPDPSLYRRRRAYFFMVHRLARYV